MDNITYERGVFQRNNVFSASIEGDDIYQINWNAQKNLIGVSTKKYNELKEVANKYYDILIDKGIIEKPKTQEEIVQEQQKLMNDMFSQMKLMQEEINNLRNTNTVDKTKSEEKLEEESAVKEEKKNEKKLLSFK